MPVIELMTMLAIGLSPAESVADEPEPDWTAGAFVDVAYGLDTNFPANHVYRGQARVVRSGEFSSSLAAAYLFHEPQRRLPFRLQLALQAGSDAEATWAAEPAGSFVGAEAFKHVGLANVGLVGPWGWTGGHTTEVGAGVFSSPIGIGGFWSKDNWNYTSAWANSATPFYLMGAHVTQSIAGKVKVGAWVVNGWQIVGESNDAPSTMGVLSATPIEGLSLAQHVYAGPEHDDLAPRAWRVHSDTQILYETERFGVGAFWDYGQERRTDLFGQPVDRWTGGALLGRVRVLPFRHGRWDMGLRPDFWWDQAGAIFGEPQWLFGSTYTNSLRLFDHAIVRLEYRYDRSSRPDGWFYVGDAVDPLDALAADRHAVYLSIVGTFERRFSTRRR